jgi:hypothetical protein
MAGTGKVGGPREGVRFEAACAWCGPVVVERDSLRVFVSERGAGLLELLCPRCARPSYRSLTISDLEALAVAGVLPTAGRAPFELLEERTGPPIGWDDLIEFHQAIAERDAA